MSSRIAVCGQHPVSTATISSVGQHRVAPEEVGVLGRVDVVGDDADAYVVAERAAQRGDERGLAAADRSADADAERVGVGARAGRPVRVDLAVAVIVVSGGRQEAKSRTSSCAWRSAASEERTASSAGQGADRAAVGEVDRVVRRSRRSIGRSARDRGVHRVRIESEQAHGCASRAGSPCRRRRRARRRARRGPAATAAAPSRDRVVRSVRVHGARLREPGVGPDASAARTSWRPSVRETARSAGDASRASASASIRAHTPDRGRRDHGRGGEAASFARSSPAARRATRAASRDRAARRCVRTPRLPRSAHDRRPAAGRRRGARARCARPSPVIPAAR